MIQGSVRRKVLQSVKGTLVRLVDLTRKREDPNDLAVRQIGNISSRRLKRSADNIE